MRAHLYYLKRPFRDFLPLLASLIILLIAGSIAFHSLYPRDQQGLTYAESLFITYSLLFQEHLLRFPEHWLLRVFYILLPPLGLIVILDGIIRFSYHILRRDEKSPEWVYAMCKTLNNHVVLCGLGKVGLRVLQQLIAIGEQVAVLEKDPLCPNMAYARKHGIPVHVGQSREEGVFENLNVAHAKSVILATDDDLANLEMALDVRRIKPDIRVVLRVFDQELASKVRNSLGMPLTFSASELVAPLFAMSSTDRSIVNSFYVGDRLLVVANLVVNPESELIGKSIREMGKERHIFVLSHTRGEDTSMFPSGDTVFESNDRITVQIEPSTLKWLHQLNRDPEPY